VKGTSAFAKYETTVASLEKYAATGLDGIFVSEQPEINCYPNPFSDEINIEIRLAKDSEVQVEVLNQLGQRVKNITPKNQFTRGMHRLTWNGRNSSNEKIAPGIYYLKIRIDDGILHRKIVYAVY
jgi:flagellar hook assembly protein FlgD